jgi:hypothetical protein
VESISFDATFFIPAVPANRRGETNIAGRCARERLADLAGYRVPQGLAINLPFTKDTLVTQGWA